MPEAIPDFQERLVMNLEGRLDRERPFSHLCRMDAENGIQPVADAEYLYFMMAAQEDDRFRPRGQGAVPEYCRRVLAGPTQLSLLINAEKQGDLDVKEGLLAMVGSVRRVGGWTLAYGGSNIGGPAAHAFLSVPKLRRFFSSNSALNLGLLNESESPGAERSRIVLVEEIRRMVLRAAAPANYKQVEKRLHDAFGDSLSTIKDEDSVSLNAYWMHRYSMATKTTPKRDLRQRFLEATGLPPGMLLGTEAGRFFEENL